MEDMRYLADSTGNRIERNKHKYKTGDRTPRPPSPSQPVFYIQALWSIVLMAANSQEVRITSTRIG